MKKRRQCLILMLLLFLTIGPIHSLCAAGNDSEAPPVTRWMTPEEIAKPLHQPLREIQQLVVQRVISDRLRPPAASTTYSGRICILVNQNVYTDIVDELAQYEADLRHMGFDTITYQYLSGTPEALRTQLVSLYQQPESLVGAVLIGYIPYIVYELMQDWGDGDEYEDFPCDIFYMDLDGSWSDSLSDGTVQPNNGKYDTRGGNLDLEIWVSRLRTDNLPSLGMEKDILIDYFDKNHRYRRKELMTGNEALVYNDDDWDYLASDDATHLEMIYEASLVTTVSEKEETTASDYIKNQLTSLYEFIFLRSHGWPGGHGFYRNNEAVFDYVYSDDYRLIDPTAVFYSLYVCSGADFTVSDNLAGTIALNPDDSGLLSIGSTKTGGMWLASSFYTALANGSVFGEAFRQWFNSVQYSNPSCAPLWWYGMVLIGDGALVRSAFLDDTIEGDFDGDGDVDGYDLSQLVANPALVDLVDFTAVFGSTE